MPRQTKSQLEILRLMASGWELGLECVMLARYWMQKGGLGYGGEARNVHATTAHSLRKKGLIERNPNKPYFPSIHYRLSEKGRKALKVDKTWNCPVCGYNNKCDTVKCENCKHIRTVC